MRARSVLLQKKRSPARKGGYDVRASLLSRSLRGGVRRDGGSGSSTKEQPCVQLLLIVGGSAPFLRPIHVAVLRRVLWGAHNLPLSLNIIVVCGVWCVESAETFICADRNSYTPRYSGSLRPFATTCHTMLHT